jgi:hypothetical protein
VSRHDLSQWLRALADGLDLADPTDTDGSAATARDWAEAIDATNHLAEYLKIEFARGQVDDAAAVSHKGPEGLLAADYAIRLLNLAKLRGAFKPPGQESK